MKSFLILSATANLLLVFIGLVNGQCYDLIHQYYQCKNLKMVKSSPSLFSYLLSTTKYKPDLLVPNNELTDRFYRKLVSNGINFDKAMKIFRKIYTETENCKSEFCECASLGVIDWIGNYSMYFRNEAVYPHAKSIIEAFNKKFESKLLSYSELKYKLEFFPLSSQNLSSLVQFCISHDYSKNRLNYYKNNFTCNQIISTKNTDWDCYWEVIVADNKIEWGENLTNSQQAKLFICQIKNFISAPTIEEQRFCTLSLWATVFPKFVWNKDMTSHIDTLLKKARTHKPKIEFTAADINTYSYLNMITVKFSASLGKNLSLKVINEEKYRTVCFDSKPLRIDCEWTLSRRGVLSWDWAHFTYNFDDSTSKRFSANMSYSYESPFESNKDITNDMLIKDKFGNNWIQIKSRNILFIDIIYIFDLKSSISVVLSPNYLGIIFPKTLIDNSEGLAINGFPELEMDLDTDTRKKRSIDMADELNSNVSSCQTICEQSSNHQSPIVDIDSILTSKAAFNKCLSDCINRL